MSSNLIIFYEGKHSIFEWDTTQIPVFGKGDKLWLEIAVYPSWEYDIKPETMKLTEFEIVDITHSLQKIYSRNMSVSYKMEVIVKKVIN